MIPVVGSPIAIVLGLVMGYGYNKRMEQWRDAVAEAITDLQNRMDKPLDLEALAEDPDFLDTLVAATRAAQGTSREEKLLALRNAVANSLLPTAPEDDLRLRFIRIIDEMTPPHLLVLRFLNDPRGWYDEHPDVQAPNILSGGKSSILGPAFSALQKEHLTRLLGDLGRWDLAVANYNTVMTAQGVWSPSTTDLGRRLLVYIDVPDPGGAS
ncbi:hypothetical protein PROP_03095 [Propionicimonas sp. T2.31MG-18]